MLKIHKSIISVGALLTILFIAGCAKKPSPAPSGPLTTSTTALSMYFPGIDTCHVWLTGNLVRTATYAKIVSATYGMTIYGAYPLPATDNFIIHFTDTIPDTMGDRWLLTFELHRAGVDTLISTSNGIGGGVSNGRKYYWMLLDGGNLPSNAIARGLYTDTL